MKIEEQLNKLPKEPGVYFFYDRFDRIIYIGKAINLRNRVRSYWNEASWSDRPKLRFMVPKVKRLETIVTKSEKEALILEANLVFKHQPKYNVLLKDNKTFPWLVITYDEKFPRLLPVRTIEKFKDKFIPHPKYAIEKKYNRKKSSNKFFGPYPNVGAMWENLHLVYELFPLRHRKAPAFKTRPCLNYDIGKCLGPCQGLVDEYGYNAMLEQVEMILNGNYNDLKSILEEQMYRASDEELFEEAAKYRDQIFALGKFNEKQNVITHNENIDQDIFALVIDPEKDFACGQVFKTRAGKVINRDTIDIEFDRNDTELEIFEAMFVQYYSKVQEHELPKEILLSHELKGSDKQDERQSSQKTNTISEQENSYDFLSDWLSERKGAKVNISTPKRGERYSQVELARRNARVIIEQMRLTHMEESSKNLNSAVTNLQRELDLLTEPSHIECFDISHIQGSNTVASMVCFIDGMAAKDKYRKYKISKDQNNDFESMREVIRRRYQGFKGMRHTDGSSIEPGIDGSLPNLIIIDGGKGQLSSAVEIMKEYELEHIPIIGLAKKEEEIFLVDQSKPIILDRKSPELFLIQRIRNEAHRFAISYHRQLRSKKALESGLDHIPGLGPAKKKALLDKFGTVSKLKKASAKEISELQGFSQSLAERILGYL